MSAVFSLSRPELLTFTGAAGEFFRGADQEWYRDPWQRMAGCGPTTASVLLSYLGSTRPALAPLASPGGRTSAGFLPYMEEVWTFVTPGPMGLKGVDKLTGGCEKFAEAHGVLLSSRALDIPRRPEDRPSLTRCTEFLRAGLSADCPVAFLNYSNGSLTNLEDWHWVPLVALEEREDTLVCTVLDGGLAVDVDFSLWYRTTRLGGGLAYFA